MVRFCEIFYPEGLVRAPSELITRVDAGRDRFGAMTGSEKMLLDGKDWDTGIHTFPFVLVTAN